MDWIGLSCDYIKFLAIAAIIIGVMADPFERIRFGPMIFPRKWGFPALGIFFVLTFILMMSDQC